MVQVFLRIQPNSTNVVDPETTEAAAAETEGEVEEENKVEVEEETEVSFQGWDLSHRRPQIYNIQMWTNRLQVNPRVSFFFS